MTFIAKILIFLEGINTILTVPEMLEVNASNFSNHLKEFLYW